MDATLLLPPYAGSALELTTWPHGDRFTFEDAVYDETTDRLRLTCGPVTATSAELTPEGHVVRVAAPDGRVCGLVLVDVHERLARDGRIEVTLGPRQFASLSADEVASLISRAVVRSPSRRFARVG